MAILNKWPSKHWLNAKKQKPRQKYNATYLFTALGGHLGAALPVAGVAAHCKKQTQESASHTEGVRSAALLADDD